MRAITSTKKIVLNVACAFGNILSCIYYIVQVHLLLSAMLRISAQASVGRPMSASPVIDVAFSTEG